MSRYVYINGEFLAFEEAVVSVEDRAYLFGDGVYDVIHFVGKNLVDGQKHLDRLVGSAKEIRISSSTLTPLPFLIDKLISLNRIDEGFVYIQLSRGIAPRNHLFPDSSVRPSLFLFIKRMPFQDFKGVSVITGPDTRWAKCQVKSINLLPNVLAKQEAADAGAYETWFVDEKDQVSEGTLSNAWIVKNDTLYTAPTTMNILNGITRQRLIQLAKKNDIKVLEQSFTVKEALSAQEAFITSTNSPITPVIKINNHSIGNGKIGPFVQKLHDLYLGFVKSERTK
ncbi:MAG: D-amino acid aminotransferase [Alphaproteobacteria bacterium]